MTSLPRIFKRHRITNIDIHFASEETPSTHSPSSIAVQKRPSMFVGDIIVISRPHGAVFLENMALNINLWCQNFILESS